MSSVHVTRSIPAPPEAVFDLLTDHADYDRFRGIGGSELLGEGDPPPNGVGALRRIGPARSGSRRRSPPTRGRPGSTI